MIAITILVPECDIKLPDAVVITFPLIPGQPLDQYIKSTGDIEIEGLKYDILEVKSEYEEAIDQLILDRSCEDK